MVVVSGTGEPRADFARVSTAGNDVVEAVRAYLTMGGDRNVAECVKFLVGPAAADRLRQLACRTTCPSTASTCRTSRARRIDDWEQQCDPAKPTAAMLFYRAHVLSGNIAFVDELTDALDDTE